MFHDGDTALRLEELLETYSPLYAQADIHIDCTNSTPDETIDKIMLELNRHISKQQMKSGQKINHA